MKHKLKLLGWYLMLTLASIVMCVAIVLMGNPHES
jgi:hypothetical protein